MITGVWISWWLLTEAFRAAFYFWPVSLVLGMHSFAAIALSPRTNRASHFLALLVPFIWPVLIVTVGGFCWQSVSEMENSAVPVIGITMLFSIQILLSAGIIYEVRGSRWTATAVSLVAAWLGLICWFLTGMSLTHMWV
jgi:hypothetical protein